MASRGTARWAVRIVEHDGKGHLLCETGGGVAVYDSKPRAEAVAESMRDGLGHDVQDVSVARASKKCADLGAADGRVSPSLS